ncbi:MAG: eukaryotic-like serine/threonine-protein kinase [Acidobacteriota bacterium]|nr:eukaryotic-like serine/threonine-protein kinase [Acidobacteriota bacterium]
MGTVYEAIDLRFNSQVALKETHFTEEALRKQFEREAHLLYKLRHPAIARVIDHFTEGEGQFLVMDYIEGEDLGEKLEHKGGVFPVEAVLTWGDQLLDALSYLHRQNPPIIHRDIKPQNLKLTDTGQIILLDFGLAKGFAGQISRVTTSGSIFGYTPNYAPLEQIHGTGTDARSDIYSLAATLYHLLTGKVPPDALSRAMALTNEQPEPLYPANAVNPNVPSEVASVLQKAMAQSANKRFASVVEMRQALQNTSQSISPGETQRVKPQETVREVLPSPLDVVPPIINGDKTEEIVSTLVAPPPVIPPQQYRDSFPQPVRKSRRLPLMIAGISAALIIGLIVFAIAKRSGSTTGNSASVLNLEGTRWQGKMDGYDKEHEVILIFEQNGKIIEYFDGDDYYGTWTTQSNKVFISIPGHSLDGTIEGDEMKGDYRFDSMAAGTPDRFVVRRIKTTGNAAIANTQSSNPTPSTSPVLNLEGTEWKGKRFYTTYEFDEIFKFMPNGKMQEIDSNYTSDGTWIIQGDKVLMSVTNPRSTTGTYKIEGTIQGDKMSGEFILSDNSRHSFVLYRVNKGV